MSNVNPLGTGVPVTIDYTSRDYQSVLSDLKNLIPTFLPEWTSTSPSDLGIALLELFSYICDIDNYYIDRIGNEAFLPTAQQRASVLNLAYLIDYAPQDATPASAQITVTLPPQSSAFTLPKGSQFATQATTTQPAIVFELDSDHTIPANSLSTPASVASTVENGVNTPLTVVQGVTVYNEPVGTSNGNANQTFTLFNTGVIDGSVQVSIDEGSGYKPWQSVRNLIEAGPYDAVFTLAVDANGVIYVSFGDNVNGRIPNPQGIIQATYRVGGGSIGNVGANRITVDQTNLGYFASVTNPNPAVGGADPETVSQIQVNAPKSITAAGRCVTLQDYAAVALDIPGVQKASSIATTPGLIQLYVHPGGGPYRTVDLDSMVSQLSSSITYGGAGLSDANGNSGYLDSRKMAATSISVLAPVNTSPPTYPVTGVTNSGTSVTFTSAAPVAVGQLVTVAGVAGITNVNGTWAVTAVGSGTFTATVTTAPSGTYAAATGTTAPAKAYVQVAITLTVNVLPQYDKLQIEQDVLTAITTLLDFGSVDFEQRVTVSSIYHAVQAVPGVDYLSITAMGRAPNYGITLSGVADVVCGVSEIPVVYDPDTSTAQISITTVGGL